MLNRFAFLTQYDDADKLAAERARLMQTENPYGIGAYLGGVTSTAFKPLSFAQPIVPGEYGPFYEIRTYTIAPGGQPETEEACCKVIPRRNEMSMLLTIMGSVEGGPQKMVHIWPYKTIEDRVKARSGKQGRHLAATRWIGAAHLAAVRAFRGNVVLRPKVDRRHRRVPGNATHVFERHQQMQWRSILSDQVADGFMADRVREDTHLDAEHGLQYI